MLATLTILYIRECHWCTSAIYSPLGTIYTFVCSLLLPLYSLYNVWTTTKWKVTSRQIFSGGGFRVLFYLYYSYLVRVPTFLENMLDILDKKYRLDLKTRDELMLRLKVR